MFNATHFTYDGVYSGVYGLMIADFDDSGTTETAAFSPVLHTIKPATLNRFFHTGITYDELPQHQFSILSETPIPDVTRREILSWLVARDSFKVLQIHQPDLEDYYYRCVFTDVQIIFVNGHCCGFRLTANFDSPYQYGRPTGFSDKVISGTEEVTIINNSDVHGYVFPKVVFQSSTGLESDALPGNTPLSIIKITNLTDSTNRVFEFVNLYANETVTVDNEMRYIKSDRNGEKLSNFNKNWLRLRPGKNVLKIETNGTVSITCPTYIMMGF